MVISEEDYQKYSKWGNWILLGHLIPFGIALILGVFEVDVTWALLIGYIVLGVGVTLKSLRAFWTRIFGVIPTYSLWIWIGMLLVGIEGGVAVIVAFWEEVNLIIWLPILMWIPFLNILVLILALAYAAALVTLLGFVAIYGLLILPVSVAILRAIIRWYLTRGQPQEKIIKKDGLEIRLKL